MPIGFHGKIFTQQVQVVQLETVSTYRQVSDGGAVTFPKEFKNIPSVIVVPPVGSDGTWDVSGTSTSGCTIQLLTTPPGATETKLPASIDFEIVVVACERP